MKDETFRELLPAFPKNSFSIDLAINKQAQRTQFWQTKYFLDISPDKEIDLTKAKDLLSLDK